MNAITLHELTKNYGNTCGIKHVNLEIKTGEFYGFIGPNGAGKSTTIKLLFNFIFPTGGSASIFGLDAVADSAKIKLKTSYVPSEVRYYADMRVDELFKTTLAFHHRTDTQELDRLCGVFEIERGKKLGELSLGNKKKVAVVSALLCDPELIVLDEPTSGLDPLMQRALFEILTDRNSRGVTVFLSSHNLTEVQEHCTKAAFIKEGEILDIQDFTVQREREKIITLWGAKNLQPLFSAGAVKLAEENGKAMFTYKNDLSLLAHAIGESCAKDFTVENPSLETRFLSYYKGDSVQ